MTIFLSRKYRQAVSWILDTSFVSLVLGVKIYDCHSNPSAYLRNLLDLGTVLFEQSHERVATVVEIVLHLGALGADQIGRDLECKEGGVGDQINRGKQMKTDGFSRARVMGGKLRG
jgi:hypothetical protein